MANFQYRAVDSAGTVSTGVITASDEGAALQALRIKQMRVLSLEASNGLPSDRQSAEVDRSGAVLLLDENAVQVALQKLSRNDVSARRRKNVSEDDVMRLAWECFSPQGYRWIKPCASRSTARVRGHGETRCSRAWIR